jgi:hypothetical protein
VRPCDEEERKSSENAMRIEVMAGWEEGWRKGWTYTSRYLPITHQVISRLSAFAAPITTSTPDQYFASRWSITASIY